MEFDLRTCDAAYRFVVDFIGEYNAKMIVSANDFELFWNRNVECIKTVNISALKINAFHILGSINECREIKAKGLMDLQRVLVEDTALKRMLAKAGIEFDIPNKRVVHNGNSYDIDYEKSSSENRALCRVAYRVFCDYCVNGFFLNDDVNDYGTDIHKRPEFLLTLGWLFPEAQQIDNDWRLNAKSYRIDFYATVDQVDRISFGLIYKNWSQLDDDIQIKKWMLSHAIRRARNELEPKCLYIKPGVIVPANQIICVSELPS